MNIDNIEKIMSSELWLEITNNENYLNYFILDTITKDNARVSGQFFVLLVFFKYCIAEETLRKFSSEARDISEGESLDCYEPYHFYGNTKMLRFS
jgi:hypothetical protein